MTASNMLIRANTLVYVEYGEDLGTSSARGEPTGYNDLQSSWVTKTKSPSTDLQSSFTDSQSSSTDMQSDCFTLKNSLVNTMRKLVTPIEKLQEEYIDEEKEILNIRGQKYLDKLYINNEVFGYEIINFVRDKKELELKKILDGRCKTNTLKTDGNKYLTECIMSNDNTEDIVEIMAKYVEWN